MIGDGVEAAGALEESEVMRYEAEAEEGGAEAAGAAPPPEVSAGPASVSLAAGSAELEKTRV